MPGKTCLSFETLAASFSHFTTDVSERFGIENFCGEWKNLVVFNGDVSFVNRLKCSKVVRQV